MQTLAYPFRIDILILIPLAGIPYIGRNRPKGRLNGIVHQTPKSRDYQKIYKSFTQMFRIHLGLEHCCEVKIKKMA